MRRLLLSLSAALLIVGLGAFAPPPKVAPKPAARAASAPVRLSYIFSDGNIPGTIDAFQRLMAAHPELQGKVELNLLTESTYAATKPADVTGSNVLVFDTMNEQMLGKFNDQNPTDLLAEVMKRGVVVGVGEGLLPATTYTQRGVLWDPRARAYWQNSGAQNRLALMEFALQKAGVATFDLPAPQSSTDNAFYYTDGKDGRVFGTWEEFDAWRKANGKVHPGAPRIAIGFYKAAYYDGDTKLIDALIHEVERQGGEAIPLFGYPGPLAFEGLLLAPDGKPRADAGLGLNFQFVDTESSKHVEKLGIPVLNLISLYGRSEEDWRKSASGLSSFEGTFELAAPELAGTIAPTVVGTKEKLRDPATGLTSVITSPLPERVKMAVSRAMRYAALRQKPNAEKRVALLYYNYPPGKAGIGASYLNVAESLANILKRMGEEGYDIGGPAPSADEVLVAITTKARNIGSDAPGELAEMIAAGGPNGGSGRAPMSEYRRWLDGLAPTLKAKMLKDWGAPEAATIMVDRAHGEPAFIIPAVRYGKVLLTPQPSRAWGDDLVKLYHAKDLAPHHQYFAAYAWLKHDYKADAVVHIGTHGTLEWLDGRDAGLGDDDAPDALISDLPDAYIYNVDVVGEGLVARRRGMAELIDHMVPPFKKGGLTEELAKLGELINDHERNESKNPELADASITAAREQALKLGIGKDLGLADKAKWTDEDLHRIESYLLELKEQKIPYGLHAFGRLAADDAIASTVDAVVSADRSQLPDARKVMAADMDRRIRTSAKRELDGLMLALGGQFVPAGLGGEPIRNPDAYPTGANFYGIDPDKVPKPAAWAMGSKLAQQMLDDHLRKTGKPLEKVSFVIWGDETMRHEGVLESQIFYMLGTKPVWNDRGKVVGVEVIPCEKLGRPRVDIVIASAAEGMFNNVTKLMDQAVQKVRVLDEADNAVRRHSLATKAALIAKGVPADKAEAMSGVRIFDEPPGTFNLNTSTIVANSGSWDTDAGFSNDYIRKMGHGFGNGYWGEAMPDVFRLNLSGVQTVVHSSSTALYGALDNDDMFMYVGGLSAAVRNVDGVTPDVQVTDTRDPGHPAMTGLDQFIGGEFRSRYVNPEWIKGMQKEGYAGAGAMREFVEYLWGWKATVPTSVDDQMWNETYATYVEDKHKLGMKAWFEAKSPFAYQDITARMIETVRKGAWNADEATKAKLLNEYVQSIAQHGVNCTEVSCANGRLLEYVMQEAPKAGVPAPAVAKAKAALEKAMGKSIPAAAQSLRAFVARNEAMERAERTRGQAVAHPAAPSPAAAPDRAKAAPTRNPAKAAAAARPAPSSALQVLKGLLMTEERRSAPPQAKTVSPAHPLGPFDLAWPVVALLALLGLWRWRGRAPAGA